jgi:hypothetical protein
MATISANADATASLNTDVSSKPSQVIDRVWQRLGEFVAQAGIRLNERALNALSRNPDVTARQRPELCNRSSIHRHAKPLPCLHAAQ